MNDKKNGLLNDIIQRSFSDLTTNNFRTLGMPEEPIWDRPFFGVAAGDDPYFDFLKEHIGDFYWSPAEAFKLRTGRDVPAGLGTFGLSDGFITEKGMAIRLTSYIVESDFDVTDRGDRGPYDWCLYYAKGTCGVCIKRCPVDAITKENGRNKQICFAYEDEAVEKYWPEHIDKKDYTFGCGLCQSMVPCRDKKPL